MRAANGQIWKCKSGVPVGIHNEEHRRKIYIDIGELVEFRFWFPANFRVVGDPGKEDIYCSLPEDKFYECFEYVGEVFSEVYQRNNNSIKDIISARLYHEKKITN